MCVFRCYRTRGGRRGRGQADVVRQMLWLAPMGGLDQNKIENRALHEMRTRTNPATTPPPFLREKTLGIRPGYLLDLEKYSSGMKSLFRYLQERQI